jgi:hypothetical protein
MGFFFLGIYYAYSDVSFQNSKKQKKSRMTQKLGLRLFAVAENFLTLLNRTTDRTNC